MIVFKNYFKVLKKQKGIIFLYTAILLCFTLFSTGSNANNTVFKASKPNITIINYDKQTKIIKNINKYLNNVANVKDFEESKIDDALFYQDIDAVVYIYDGYTNDYLNNQEKELDVKYSTGSNSSYAVMLLEQYFKIADVSNDILNNEDEIINTINDSIKTSTKVTIKSELDVDSLDRASYFYTFSNYSILSICIYITALMLLKFNQEKIKKRNIISSKKSSSITMELYLANVCFTLIVWVALIILSIIIVGDVMFTANGILYIINSLIFMLCALSIGFLTGNLISNQNAISAIVNIVGLGSSFICGSFIPVQYLPDIVVKCAKVLPSYWYINNNSLIASLETYNFNSLKPLILNCLIVLLFMIIFIVINLIITKKSRHIK